MKRKPELDELLGQYIFEADIAGTTIIAKLATNKLRPLNLKVSNSNIKNWLNGTARTVRDWRQVAAIANVLNLDDKKAKTLFHAAGHLTIEELRKKAKEEELFLLELWATKPDKYATVPVPVDFFTGREEES
jgi:hypothetical protein